ncbi:MAG: hypothetical protein ABI903_10940 [Actinomycetota bacterium]
MTNRMENDHDGDDQMTAHTWPSPAPVSCQPWCEAGDGHPNMRLREDQCCFSVEHRVQLSLEPTEMFGEGSTEQQYLNTYLMRSADDKEPRVFIGYNEAPGRPATMNEAREFAHKILALIGDVEAQARRGEMDATGQVGPRAASKSPANPGFGKKATG